MSTITRHNLVTNPSFEAGLTNWSANGTNAPTLAQVSNPWPGAGTKSMRFTMATGTPGGFNGAKINITTVIGVTYTASAWVYIPTGTPPFALLVSGVAFGSPTHTFDQWTQLTLTFTATATTHSLQFWCTGSSISGQLAYADAVLVETGTTVYAYFDGDSVGASWDGTTQLSASTFSAFFIDASLPLTVIEIDSSPIMPGDFILDVSNLDGNVLSGDNATFTASVGNWTNHANTNVTRTTSQFHSSPSAMQMSSIASGDMEVKHCADANILTQAVDVIEGNTVTITAWFRSAVSVRSCQIGVGFYDNSATQIGSFMYGTSFLDSTSGWTLGSSTFTVPGGATNAVLHCKVLATGGVAEVHYMDDPTIVNDGQAELVASPRYIQPSNYGDIISQCTIDRGTDDPNGDINVGSCTLYADNWSGNFDPENQYSTYNNDPRLGLVKGMRCRVSVLFASGGVYTAETIFVGRLQNVTLREGLQPDATLTFADDLALMGNVTMPMFDNSIRSGETGLSRLNWLYYNVGYLDVQTGNDANFSSGLTKLIVPTYGGGSVLDEMADVTAAHAGRYFVSKDGVFTVLDHDTLVLETPIATLSDNVTITGIEYADVQTSSGTMQIINAARAHVYTQPSVYFPEFFYADADSVARYGQNQFNGSVGYRAPLYTPGDLLAMAIYVATRFSKPITRYDSVTIDFAGNGPASALLGAEIGQQVVISRTMPYLSGPSPYTLNCVIEGIKWTITDSSFVLQLITSPTDAAELFGGSAPFVIGTSLLNSTDVLSAI